MLGFECGSSVILSKEVMTEMKREWVFGEIEAIGDVKR